MRTDVESELEFKESFRLRIQGVAVWMKQLGGIRPGGNLEDFPEDLRIREFPKTGTVKI